MPKKKKGPKYSPMDRKVRRRMHRRSLAESFPLARTSLGKPLTPTKRKKAAKTSYRNMLF